MNKFLPPGARIEICGGIAAGKTTLALLLKALGFEPILEAFQANPFWKAFYENPTAVAFETELSFLLQHYHDIKRNSNLEKLYTCDFSFHLDLAYSRVTLPDSKRKVFDAVFAEIIQELSPPLLVIHLQCAPEVELARIHARGRVAEQSIDLHYLDKLNRSLAGTLKEHCGPDRILAIDSSRFNFRDDKDDIAYVLKMIEDRLPALFHPSAVKPTP